MRQCGIKIGNVKASIEVYIKRPGIHVITQQLNCIFISSENRNDVEVFTITSSPWSKPTTYCQLGALTPIGVHSWPKTPTQPPLILTCRDILKDTSSSICTDTHTHIYILYKIYQWFCCNNLYISIESNQSLCSKTNHHSE